MEVYFDEEAEPQAVEVRDVAAELDPPAPLTPADQRVQDAADLLRTLLIWLADSRDLSSVGRRTLCLIWLLRPRSLQGISSLDDLANRYGGTKQSYSKFSKEVLALGRGLFQSPTTISSDHRKAEATAHRRNHEQ